MSSTPNNSTPQIDDAFICRLEIDGDLSGNRVIQLENEFTEALSAMEYKKVALNILTASTIDSPGLALCVGLYKECKNKKLEFEINVNKDISRIFKLVNLDKVLPIKESE